MKSRSYYSVPSTKSRKTISGGKKGRRAPLTLEESEKNRARIHEANRKKRKLALENEKRRMEKPGTKQKIFFSALADSSNYVFHHPKKAIESAKKLASEFPDYSDVRFEEVFIAYTELMNGKELSYKIDSDILEHFLRYIVKKKPIYIVKNTVLSLESFCKKSSTSPLLRGSLRHIARKYHIFINI